jgi:hypothetical protein
VLRPPTAAEQAYVRENVQGWAGEELASRALTEVDEPNFVPAVMGMLFDTLGNLWVARFQVDYTQTPDFDIFDAEGVYLGGFRFPDNFMPREIGADYVLGILRSDLDVPKIQVWGLQR